MFRFRFKTWAIRFATTMGQYMIDSLIWKHGIQII